MNVSLGYVFKTGYLNIPLEAMFFYYTVHMAQTAFPARKSIMTIARMKD